MEPTERYDRIGPSDDQPRTLLEGIEFNRLLDADSGRVIQNLELRHCSFRNCTLSLGFDPGKRTVVRRVTVSHCRVPLRFGTIGAPIFDEVTVEDFRSGQVLLLWGAAFRHVVFKGRMPQIIFNERTARESVSSDYAERFVEANREFYRQVDWAVDISAAEFASMRLTSVPGELVRIDPRTQIRINRSRLAARGWADLPLPSITRVAIEQCMRSKFEYQVVAAGRRSKFLSEELRGIEILREEGLES
jgi:hypothetical protein